MIKILPSKLIALSMLVVGWWYTTLVYAETITVIVEPNDTLIRIITKNYPAGTPLKATMEAVLVNNPSAFINGDINRLVRGERLVLPNLAMPVVNGAIEAVKIASTEQNNTSSAPTNQEFDPPALLLERVKRLEDLRLDLTQQLQKLEAENKSLHELVSRYETEKQQRDVELKKLEDQIEQLEAAAQEQKKTDAAGVMEQISQLQTTLNGLKEENSAIQRQLEDSKNQLNSSTQENATLKQQLSQVEIEKQRLSLEQQKANDLTEKLAQVSLDRQQLATQAQQAEALRTELEHVKTSNAQLSENLKASQAAAQSAVVLPPYWLWLLLGLLGLLLLPFFWLRTSKAKRVRANVAPSASPVVRTSVEVDPLALTPSVVKSSVRDAEKASIMPVSGANFLEGLELSGDTHALKATKTTSDPYSDPHIKLNIARAYMDMRSAEAAFSVLQEVLREGDEQQKQEAREILSFIS